MYKIPRSYKEELIQYRELVNKALLKEVDEVQFKIFRVVRGIYEQRSKGTYMVRIRCAGGTISPSQLSLVCEIAEKYGSTFLHITTRQEIQLHNLRLADTPDILEGLYKVGLSTKGSGGNTVRNITASPESGVSPNEVFDVTPYNIALTNFLLDYDKSFDLPRKLKIAFSSSEEDTALAAFNDLGFIAQIKDGKKGFKVYLGGSPSVKPMVGELLFGFLPADKIFGATLAVIEMFNTYGNRKNRHKARLRYLFYKMGKEKVFELFHETYNQFKNKDYLQVPELQHKLQSPEKTKPGNLSGNGIEQWEIDYVSAQPNNGFCTVEIPVMHGNLTNIQAKTISGFASHFGDDTIRFSRRQNIHLRNIPGADIGILHNTLNDIGIQTNKPKFISNLVSCTGADTCQLGICFSKGGLQAIHDRLVQNQDLHSITNLSINISGCPNSCGQHLVADLGFAGRVSRNNRIYPSYNVFVGAVIGSKKASLPIQIGEIAAKDLPDFTNDILTLFSQNQQHKTFRNFIEEKMSEIQVIIDSYKNIPSYEENRKYYIDWGNNDLFTLDTRGGGECSAGLLDLIESELKIISKCKESFSGQQEIEEQTVLLHEMVLAASKLLCLTTQNQSTEEQELFEIVTNDFVAKNKITGKFTDLFSHLKEGDFKALIKNKQLVHDFVNTAIKYYQNLDDSLQVKSIVKEITATQLKQLMDNNSNIKLIDVRESWEKEIADIGGELIPLGAIDTDYKKIPNDIQTIIYCRTGRRSAEAINLLANTRNTDNLYNLKGGIYSWADEVDSTIQKY